MYIHTWRWRHQDALWRGYEDFDRARSRKDESCFVQNKNLIKSRKHTRKHVRVYHEHFTRQFRFSTINREEYRSRCDAYLLAGPPRRTSIYRKKANIAILETTTLSSAVRQADEPIRMFHETSGRGWDAASAASHPPPRTLYGARSCSSCVIRLYTG